MNRIPRAARKEAGFLLVALAAVLGLLAGSPLSASLPEQPLGWADRAELASLDISEAQPFTLASNPHLSRYGELFSRVARVSFTRVRAPESSLAFGQSLPENRVWGFRLFGPKSRLGLGQLSPDIAAGYRLFLPGNRVGPYFQGLWTDPVTGISYARNRWYDARFGAFLSEDPMGDVDSPTLYQFGMNSPFNYSDPMGLESAGIRQDSANLEPYRQDLKRRSKEWCEANPVECEQARVSAEGQQMAAIGCASAVVGGVTAPSGVGLAVAGIGADECIAGVAQAISGEKVNSLQYTGIKKLWMQTGISEEDADSLTSRSQLAVGLANFGVGVRNFFKTFNRRVPAHLTGGQSHEASRLAALDLPKNTTVFRPEPMDLDTAAFKAIVGEAKYTPQGKLKGTIFDSVEDGLLEIKGGSSTLGSSYQLRLQIYYSVREGIPLTIESTRPVGQTFRETLEFWGVRMTSPGG